ncbi:MAG TPA: FliA/WhiG family RNA polymerase sigma factor [Chloroflexota bacterium]|nr:FliA/WhiG family RNA polymerase sigma factor [Chloroflexota bacterium]
MAAAAVIEDLWQAHCGRGDRSARESIILQYAPLVKYVTGRLSIALPPVLDMDDVLSSGMVGLIRAVEHYDPTRGVPFENYAVTCIKGAILDQLRSLDVISRSVRQKAREIEKAITALQITLGRLPNDREVAEHLGMDINAYRKVLTEVGPATISIDSVMGGDGESEVATLLSTLEDTNSPDPVSLAERRGLLDALAEAISRLSDRERLLLALYYKEELTMREISRVMDVSESRVCQLHTRAVLRLKAQLQLWRQQD